MKQLYDLTDNQPIPQIAVQPKLDPNGGLVENEQGLGVKPQTVVMNRNITPASGVTVSENMFYTQIGRLVIVDIANIKTTQTTQVSLGTGLPVARTRATCIACGALGEARGLFYINVGSTELKVNNPTANQQLFGQLVYLTD